MKQIYIALIVLSAGYLYVPEVGAHDSTRVEPLIACAEDCWCDRPSLDTIPVAHTDDSNVVFHKFGHDAFCWFEKCGGLCVVPSHCHTYVTLAALASYIKIECDSVWVNFDGGDGVVTLLDIPPVRKYKCDTSWNKKKILENK